MNTPDSYRDWARRVTVVALLAALALPLAACGKKGPLDPPPGAEDSQFPRQYPTR
jgi:predicted small lipoprotein YifL